MSMGRYLKTNVLKLQTLVINILYVDLDSRGV